MTAIEIRPSSGVAGMDALERTAARHFDLYFYSAILRLRLGMPGIEQAAAKADSPFAFLASYLAELETAAGIPEPTDAVWYEAIERWESASDAELPLRALRIHGGLSHDTLTAYALVSVVDEDNRFGLLFDTLQNGAGKRPSAALIADCWPATDARRAVKRSIDQLRTLGLIEALGGAGDEARCCSGRRQGCLRCYVEMANRQLSLGALSPAHQRRPVRSGPASECQIDGRGSSGGSDRDGHAPGDRCSRTRWKRPAEPAQCDCTESWARAAGGGVRGAR